MGLEAFTPLDPRPTVSPHTLDLSRRLQRPKHNDFIVRECDFGPAPRRGLGAGLQAVSNMRLGVCMRSFMGQPWARPPLPSVGRNASTILQRNCACGLGTFALRNPASRRDTISDAWTRQACERTPHMQTLQACVPNHFLPAPLASDEGAG